MLAGSGTRTQSVSEADVGGLGGCAKSLQGGRVGRVTPCAPSGFPATHQVGRRICWRRRGDRPDCEWSGCWRNAMFQRTARRGGSSWSGRWKNGAGLMSIGEGTCAQSSQYQGPDFLAQRVQRTQRGNPVYSLRSLCSLWLIPSPSLLRVWSLSRRFQSPDFLAQRAQRTQRGNPVYSLRSLCSKVSFWTEIGEVILSSKTPQPRQLSPAAADQGRYSCGPGPHPFLITPFQRSPTLIC